jgi:hypothetical protein
MHLRLKRADVRIFRVEKFWFDLGFRKVADSDFWSFAPQLKNQAG